MRATDRSSDQRFSDLAGSALCLRTTAETRFPLHSDIIKKKILSGVHCTLDSVQNTSPYTGLLYPHNMVKQVQIPLYGRGVVEGVTFPKWLVSDRS